MLADLLQWIFPRRRSASLVVVICGESSPSVVAVIRYLKLFFCVCVRRKESIIPGEDAVSTVVCILRDCGAKSIEIAVEHASHRQHSPRESFTPLKVSNGEISDGRLLALVCQELLAKRGPWFRNDDVSADTDIDAFRNFCGLFSARGWTQLHGVTLFGLTNSYRMHDGECVEYENTPSLGVLPNDRIRELSRGAVFEERSDLIRFLNQSPDDIAVHGLYHTDYSAMNAVEQHMEMSEALSILRRLFPEKKIQWFIAPFNRTNAETYKVADSLGLKVLAFDGVHLEESLHTVSLESQTWYRYHHHRFYPESTFPHWQLSADGLAAAFARNSLVNLPEWYRCTTR